MKKTIATLICLLVMGGMIAHAQHMTFRNVPIDGTLNEFTAKLIKQGFKYNKTYETEDKGKSYKHMDLKGDFAGFKNCIVTVDAHKKPDLVYRVCVEIKNGDWDELLLDYKSLSTALNEKYTLTALSDIKIGRPNTHDEKSVSYRLLVDSNSFWRYGVVELHLKEVNTKTVKITKLYIVYEDLENKYNPVNKVDVGDL